MKILVTGGATLTMIDKVRALTNIFRGTTGCLIAREAKQAGHDVTLLTSNKELAEKLLADTPGINVMYFATYDGLWAKMRTEITRNNYDAVVHSAAVSDYEVKDACINRFRSIISRVIACTQIIFIGSVDFPKIDSSRSRKISSYENDLVLTLRKTDKIIDMIRTPWKFTGVLVKFKLEVGLSTEELIRIAAKSVKDSDADAICANCLEWAPTSCILMAKDGSLKMVSRDDLAAQVLRYVEAVHAEKEVLKCVSS